MILVTGATGTNGKPLVKELAANGHKVRAFVRKASNAADLQGPNVEIAEGDLDDAESVKRALAGVDHAFLLTPPSENQGTLQVSFIQAAKDAGVEHLVKFSAMNAKAGSPAAFYNQHGTADELVKNSGLGYTILMPNSFMQNFLQTAGMTKSQGIVAAPIGTARISFVDVSDIVAVAVKALTEPGHAGKVYIITGPEALTHEEIAAKFSKLMGREIKFIDLKPQDFENALLGMGVPAFNARGVRELYDDWRNGTAAVVTNTVREVAGKEPVSFDQFLQRNKAAFV